MDIDYNLVITSLFLVSLFLIYNVLSSLIKEINKLGSIIRSIDHIVLLGEKLVNNYDRFLTDILDNELLINILHHIVEKDDKINNFLLKIVHQ